MAAARRAGAGGAVDSLVARATAPEAAALAGLLEGRAGSDDDVVSINVGGTVFTSLRGTLSRFEGSRLEAVLSGRWRVPRDESGRVFVDRSPALFPVVLAFLRDPARGVSLPADDADRAAVVDELEWYGLRGAAVPDLFPGSEALTAEEGLRLACLLPARAAAVGPLRLSFRASRDGFSAKAFHDACDCLPWSVMAFRTALGTVVAGYCDYPFRPGTEVDLAASRAVLVVLETLRGPASMRLRACADPSGASVMAQDGSFGPLFGVFPGPGRAMRNAVGVMVRLRPTAAAVHLGVPGCCFERPEGWEDSRLITGSASGLVELEEVEVWGPPGEDEDEEVPEGGGTT